MSNYAFFSKDSGCWGECYQSLQGCHDICLLLEQFHVTHMTQSELASLTHLKVWVILKYSTATSPFYLYYLKRAWWERECMASSLMWVHPYQARVSTIDEVVKQLTQLAPTGPNCPYALV